MDVLRAIHDRKASGLPCCGIGSVVEQKTSGSRSYTMESESEDGKRERERTMRTTRGQQINAHPSERCKFVMTSPSHGPSEKPSITPRRKGGERERRERGGKRGGEEERAQQDDVLVVALLLEL